MGHNNTVAMKQLYDWTEVGDDLIKQITESAREAVPPKRFKGDALSQLVGVSIARIYEAEELEKLPAADRGARNQRLGYTISQAIEAMKVFDTLPWRREGDDPVILSFTNFKGGCWKTTTSWYFSSWCAMQGYRVLVVDLDPQASFTRNIGVLPDRDTEYYDTLAPFLSGEIAATPEAIRDVVRKTHLPTLDIIPSSLDLQAVEWELSSEVMKAASHADKQKQAECFLRAKLALQEVMEDYDIIVVDGTPTLGLIPLNIVFGSDGVVVPVPTEIADYCSTISFLNLLHQHADQLIESFGDVIQIPEFVFLPTRFSPGERNQTVGAEVVLEQLIKPNFGDSCLNSVIRKHDAVVSNLSLLSRTAFEVLGKDVDLKPEVIRRACANYGQAFEEIMERLVYKHWPTKQLELEIQEVRNG